MKNSIIVPAPLVLALAGCTSGSSKLDSGTGRTDVCKAANEQEIPALFDRWNRSLKTGDPHKVVANDK